MDRWTNEWMDIMIEGETDRWAGGWLGRRTDGQRLRQIDRQVKFFIVTIIPVKSINCILRKSRLI